MLFCLCARIATPEEMNTIPWQEAARWMAYANLPKDYYKNNQDVQNHQNEFQAEIKRLNPNYKPQEQDEEEEEQQGEEQQRQLFIDMPEGGAASLEVKDTDTVAKIKKKIHEKNQNISIDSMRLMFSGRKLEDNQKLKDIQVGDDKVWDGHIVLVIRPQDEQRQGKTSIVYEDMPQFDPNVDKGKGEIIFQEKKTEDMMKDLVRRKPYQKFAVLNFANAISPGGFQENSFNNTTVFQQMYDDGLSNFVRGAYKKPIPKHGCIYTRNVSFKDHDLDKKFDVISAAARNYSGGGKFDREDMKHRIQTVLAAARANGVKIIILGAWGCGVFNNPPNEVAELFKEVLQEKGHLQYFDEVIFAIPDEDMIQIFKLFLSPKQ